MRLTPQGWTSADSFFLKSSEPSPITQITVIGKNYALRPATRESHMDFYFGFEELGHIDIRSMRFTPSTGIETRSFDKYSVVLKNTGQEQARERVAGESDGTLSELRIDGSQPTQVHLTAEAAMRYLVRMRRATSDPILRKNIDQTIKKLKPFQ